MMKWNEINTKYQDQLEKLKSQGPYERLGIEPGVTMDEVSKAYKKKMRYYHPDKTDAFMSKHGEEISKLLNQAIDQIRKELG